MPDVLRRFAEITPVPWRNGGGTTVELIDEDRSTTLTPGLRWRLSIAHLTAPGPFSAFPGQVRTLIPWEGDIVLSVDDEFRHVGAGEAVRFPGDARTHLVELTAPCYAVNLMASGPDPTFEVVIAGHVATQDSVAIAIAGNADASRFDVIAVRANELMPVPGILLRP
ncbi:HutD family protein [Microbacterium sp. NPDC077663]|uniref:HutD family protein n=1 Tax=Microbacterium sp. NPDC077663 TaxID=3364189 RepID=UPI0037C98F6F